MTTNIPLEAARLGRVDLLEELLQQNPSLLADYKLKSLTESLLHVAAKFGHLNFVHELMKMDHNLAREVNKDGFRPLDIAVIMGHFEIVKEIIRFNKDLCVIKGKDQRTALHYAAIKGRIKVIEELLYACPDCIQDVTVHEETALHLAVEHYQFDAFATLVKWLKTLGKEMIVNTKDGDGNSVLHVAVSTKQHAVIDMLLSETRGTIQVNAANDEGLTALDLLDMQDSYHLKIRQKLESAGAVTSLPSTSTTAKISTKILKTNHEHPPKDWVKYFKFEMQRDSPSETRNVLLLAAALIATVCFQAGINPPNGIFDKPPESNNPNQNSPPPQMSPAGGSALATAAAISGSGATLYMFLFGNTLGLTASTSIISYLTAGFPFQRELLTAMFSMMFAYGVAIGSILSGMGARKITTAYILMMVAFFLPYAARSLPSWGERALKYWKNRDHVRTPLPVSS